MKKKNGFTMVELLVSLVLITTLSLALFKTVANIQKKEQMSIARNSLTAFKTVLNSNIENDFVDDIITDIYSCGDNCFDMTFKKKGTVRLSVEDNILTYGTMKEEIPKNYKLYSNMSITFYESDEENKNAYVLLTLPLKGDLEKGFDNVKYMYLYNSKENPINDNSIKVTLDHNNNKNEKTYIKVLNGSAYGTLPSLIRSGYKFLGWFTEKTGGLLITKDSTVTKNYNHTLYAHWEYTDILYEVISTNYKCSNAQVGSSYAFTYTGDCEIVDDGNNSWRIRLLTSGDLTFSRNVFIDAFLVGGGGGGGTGCYYYACGSGGGGGYTLTKKQINLEANTAYPIVIGAGGKSYTDGESSKAFGFTAAGGLHGQSSGAEKAGDGGSAGGKAAQYSPQPGASDGGDDPGGSAKGQRSKAGPNGETGTTREFGEETGALYAGGGGASGYYHSTSGAVVPGGAGGAGGGGTGGKVGETTDDSGRGSNGTNNTGGGGGGAWPANWGGTGGSGIVIIRNKR